MFESGFFFLNFKTTTIPSVCRTDSPPRYITESLPLRYLHWVWTQNRCESSQVKRCGASPSNDYGPWFQNINISEKRTVRKNPFRLSSLHGSGRAPIIIGMQNVRGCWDQRNSEFFFSVADGKLSKLLLEDQIRKWALYLSIKWF